MISLISFVIFISVSSAIIFPPPKMVSLTTEDHSLLSSDCPSIYLFSTQDKKYDYYFQKINNRLMNRKCPEGSSSSEGGVPIIVKEMENIPNEGYKIAIKQELIQIEISSYPGYVYALESLFQLLAKKQVKIGEIYDEPLVSYRGIMIDSVRHFISISKIKKLIESMPVSKLNTIHWHLSDDEAFTIALQSHPELADYGTYSSSQKYTIEEVKDLLNFANLHGVKIVPQIDTPAHVRSWGQAPIWKEKNITILCPGGEHYNHQFDVSKSETYTLAEEVIREIDNIFLNSPYLHLGGDEAFKSCWDLRPSIATFMKLKNISDIYELQVYWRYQLKQAIPSSRKVIFWEYDGKIRAGPDDILQYWGSQANATQVLKKTQSKVILSPDELLYLSTGKTNIWSQPFGHYSVWRQIYEKFILFPEGIDKNRIIGAEVCLWGEVSDEDSLENNLWMRASAFASRVWNEKILQTHEVVEGMVEIQKILVQMKVDASPVVSQFCENSPSVCFPPPKIKVQ